MNMTIMLLLLLGFSVALNLIILRKYWDMNRPLDLQGRLYAMRAILERAKDEQLRNSTRKQENTKSPITITEAIAERALKIFHAKQPKIQQVFHAEVIEALKEYTKLIAPLPWGIDAERGGVRIFYERWGDDLFQRSYWPISLNEPSLIIPKRLVLELRRQFKEAKIILEAHDALLFSVRQEYLEDFIPLAKKEMERPINFTACCLTYEDI